MELVKSKSTDNVTVFKYRAAASVLIEEHKENVIHSFSTAHPVMGHMRLELLLSLTDHA